MTQILNISEAASLALHSAALLAQAEGEPQSARAMAARLGVSETHLAKVLQRLTRAGLVSSHRGPKGGYTLAREPEDVNLLMVYQAAEGPLTLKDCLLAIPVCSGECILGGLLNSVNHQVRRHLEGTTLAQLCHSYPNEVSHEKAS